MVQRGRTTLRCTAARCRASQHSTPHGAPLLYSTPALLKAKEEAERLHAQAQALVARRAGALHRAEKLQAERHRRAPIPPLHLPYISPISPLYLPCISLISPLYLPYISPV